MSENGEQEDPQFRTMTNTAELTQSVDGDGVFDVLMRNVKAHLDEEHQKNRIKGPEYSQVYLGALNQVMDQAVRFLLEKRRLAVELELIQAQIESEQKNKDLIAAQILKIEKEIEVMDKQICKLDAEFDVLQEQRGKVAQETSLLGQKIATELAQIDGTNVDEVSVLGRQMALHKAQTDGFKRDAEQKAASIMVDTWKTAKAVDAGVTVEGTNLHNESIGEVISILKSGLKQ